MKNKMLKNKKSIKKFIFLLSTIYYLLSTVLSGCATIPTKEALPTYNIGNITYIPLVSLCDLRDVEWQYDTFTRRFSLGKGLHKINLMVGERLVLVDGKPKNLRHPVDIYQGRVVVPYKFKKQIFDPLFKESIPSSETVLPALEIKKVVIDAGHGGTDPGAIGRTGIKEKDITLDIAKRLSSLLRASDIEVFMTRSTDKFISLSSRTDIANNSQAELFISIHANANRVRGLNGFEVYYISSGIDNSKRAMLAAGNAPLQIEASCFASESKVLKAILWDMIYTHNRAESIELARSICSNIEQNLNTKILGIKGANFYVLKGARMPAVLIEVGFLSNYKEERMLKNNYYRQQIAEALAEGIKNYRRGAVKPLSLDMGI